MINLRKRSNEKELMDGENIPFKAMEQTLKELNIINSRLGGHAITLKGLRQFISKEEPLSVCEIGCGGGDNLFAIHKYCRKKNIPVRFIGIDKSAECIAFARQQYPDLPCEWICSDYSMVSFGEKKPDIVFSSLFCHHFKDEELVMMMKWLRQNSKKGFFINDLQRHWLAWFLIKWLTRIFSKSYLVKNDACVSVARGFHKKEWQSIFNRAGIAPYTISWKWAFRWLVVASSIPNRH